MNQTGAIIEAIKWEQSDKGQIVLNNMDSKDKVLCTIPEIGSGIGEALNFTLITVDDGEWHSINLNNVVSAEYNSELQLQLNVGESFSRGL